MTDDMPKDLKELIEDDYDRLSDSDIAVILAVASEPMTKTRLQKVLLLHQEVNGCDMGFRPGEEGSE